MNPYPVFEVDQVTYQAAQNHSKQVDEWLGFNYIDLEKQLRLSEISKIHQTWSELSPQSFQTPYCELRSLLVELGLKKNDHIIDLGSAYSRLAFVIGRHHPELKFTGFEVSNMRVIETLKRLKNWQYKNVQVFHQDLLDEDFQLPEAQAYFIYDFGHNQGIQKILQNLKHIAKKQPLQVIARGRASRHFIFNENPWLTIHPPSNFEHYTIFKST